MKIPEALRLRLCDCGGGGNTEIAGRHGGWIHPDGTYISCGFAQHDQAGAVLAAWLQPEIMPSSLVELGWALVNTGAMNDASRVLYLPKRDMTQAQLDKLFDLYPQFYQELIDGAREGHIFCDSGKDFWECAVDHWDRRGKDFTYDGT